MRLHFAHLHSEIYFELNISTDEQMKAARVRLNSNVN